MYKLRISTLQKKLKEEKLDAVLVSSVSNITYLSGYANFSEKEREAYIFIGADFAYLISDARYMEEIKSNVPHLTFFERSHKNPIADLFKKHKIKNLGIEENNLTVSEFKLIKRHFKNLKHFEISRSIKTKKEIDKIEKACKIGDMAFEYILKKFKAGVTEKEIAKDMENLVRDRSAEFSFPAIVAFGKNSAVPHHHTGETVLNENEFVLLDFGVKFENYCSDMTRTFFFGKPNKKQKNMYQAVLKAQQKAVEAIEQGERKVAKIFKAAGLAIPHSLGHGIGLEVHEAPHISPKSKEILKEGMVFSIEPGIYIPNFGGVRIEDLFVLEKNSLRKLTHASVEPKII
ncbi:MAG: Xaa-Pro peptidase family protein [Candidatus Daviesbacteria bacterium]|nr:Xaa-Pro peptidase family protein [Candidatus Daviesbacteria bacterium]